MHRPRFHVTDSISRQCAAVGFAPVCSSEDIVNFQSEDDVISVVKQRSATSAYREDLETSFVRLIGTSFSPGAFRTAAAVIAEMIVRNLKLILIGQVLARKLVERCG